MQEKFLNFFKKYIDLTDHEKETLLRLTSFRTYPKGHFFVKEGDLAKDCFFVLEGCVREYCETETEDITSNFYTEFEFVLSLDSFANDRPSRNNLQCIEPTTVAIGDIEAEWTLYKECPRMETVTRIMLEEGLNKLHTHFSKFMTMSPEGRYLDLMKNRPHLLQIVPQYQLASYLGVKPESLSRIRKRMIQSAHKTEGVKGPPPAKS